MKKIEGIPGHLKRFPGNFTITRGIAKYCLKLLSITTMNLNSQ